MKTISKTEITGMIAKCYLKISNKVDDDRSNVIIWNLDNIVRRFCANDCLNFFKNNIEMYGGKPTYVHYFPRCFSNCRTKCVGLDFDRVVHTSNKINATTGYELYGIFNASHQYTLALNQQIVGEGVVLDELDLLVRFYNIIYEFGTVTPEVLGAKMCCVIMDGCENVHKFERTLKWRK